MIKALLTLNYLKYAITAIGVSFASVAIADTIVTMKLATTDGSGQSVGTIVIKQTAYGLLFSPHLIGLSPGAHGFHIHQHASCADNGMAAGGHLDPHSTGKHLGPYDAHGHLGDLPILYVNADGSASTPVLAPRLTKIAQIAKHALMIHMAGDNYADIPEKLGGGGGRMVCGIIP
jgi:superoxide dismutase, Cu-Zn family